MTLLPPPTPEAPEGTSERAGRARQPDSTRDSPDPGGRKRCEKKKKQRSGPRKRAQMTVFPGSAAGSGCTREGQQADVTQAPAGLGGGLPGGLCITVTKTPDQENSEEGKFRGGSGAWVPSLAPHKDKNKIQVS